MGHPALAPVSFISMALVLIPLPWHLRARNVATVSTFLWLAVCNLYHFVNAVLWKGNVDIRAEVYCDISTSLYVAATIALPAAALCIARHLANVSSPNRPPPNLKDKRNRIIFEIVMCVIFPFVYRAVVLISQNHRFLIFEDLGCTISVYISWPTIIVFYFPPVVLALVTAVYSGLAVRWLMQRRAQFRDLFPSASGMSSSTYFRLIALAITTTLGTLGFTLYVLIRVIASSGAIVWVSWDFIHTDYWHILQFPTAVVSPSRMAVMLAMWSVVPIQSCACFVFFGFGEEAMAEYRKYWRWVCRVILRRDANPGQSSGGNLPSFILRSSKVSRDHHKVEMSTTVSRAAKRQRDDDSLFGDRLDVEAAKDVSPSYASFETRSQSLRPYTPPLDRDSQIESAGVSVRSIHVSGPSSSVESEGEK
ncbi:hypothetical protein BS47DRAFT_1343157 [Hydnum rufescens UP504]|uniref:Pheromone receptor n=1 Tax=Hydnum rufescens UP504 TaxID=1448309 RepID=A0A9P6DX97_9AGAM|nr:hypothetical protein BS47DRAFT_1343157 [Hydnum rufescens UP504]